MLTPSLLQLAYVFLDVGYIGPGAISSIDEINQKTTETIGYPIFGYWPFFNSADAAELMDRNVSHHIPYPPGNSN